MLSIFFLKFYPQKVDKNAFAKILQLLKIHFFTQSSPSSSLVYFIPFYHFLPENESSLLKHFRMTHLQRQGEGSKTLLSLCFGIFAMKKMFESSKLLKTNINFLFHVSYHFQYFVRFIMIYLDGKIKTLRLLYNDVR